MGDSRPPCPPPGLPPEGGGAPSFSLFPKGGEALSFSLPLWGRAGVGAPPASTLFHTSTTGTSPGNFAAIAASASR